MKFFGDKFDAFKTINSDEKNRERLRAEGLATYAKKNGLAVTLYQDYGRPAKKLTISLPLTAIWQTPSVATMPRANTAYLSTA